MNSPYISIVIATYNAADFLERALQSIEAQEDVDVEIVIQDGGSTDGTLDIIRSHEASIAYAQTEPDNGIYDAWNKALVHVRGEWVLFLGADDFFPDSRTLFRAMQFLPQLGPQIMYAYGANHFVDDEQVLFTLNRSIHNLFCTMVTEMPLIFSSTFIRTELLRPLPFNTEYRISSDLELVDKTLVPGNVFRIPTVLSCMRWGGMCTRPENQERVLQERIDILRRCVQPRAYDIVSYCLQTIEDTDTTLYE